MKIKINTQRCMSMGACVQAAPHLFSQDEEGLAVALKPAPGPQDAEIAQIAAAACPVGAIEIEEDDGEE